MKTTRIAAMLASTLVLALSSSASWAHKPKPFEVDFNKCFDHDGFAPYLFTFSGKASGDVNGRVEARIVRYVPGIQPDQTLIQADYVITGSLDFTARVGGRVNDRNNQAVLRGYVSVGPAWLEGAGVHDEFTNYTKPDGTPCSKGTLYITPRWKQSQDDNDD